MQVWSSRAINRRLDHKDDLGVSKTKFRLETDLADDVSTVNTLEGRDARGLTYPCAGWPLPGAAFTVATGVLWIRLPMPIALNHVNVYAIEDGPGWAVVDTGLAIDETRDLWETILTGPLQGRPVTQLICTHMHPDHIGLAGWLCERFSAPLLMTRLEYVTARMLVSDTGKSAPQAGEDFYRAAGWDETQIDLYRREFGRFGMAVSPLPAGYTRIREGEQLTIGGQTWRVVVGEGHSPEHACLWRQSDDVVLGGDQILPRISSNVSVWPTEPRADPLGDWMDSLERMKRVLPEGALILPSHGEPFYGVHNRLDALVRGHEASLMRLARSLQRPRRAVDVFGSLFARPIGDGVRGMATGEALAHLNYLRQRGRAVCTPDTQGVDWWTEVEQIQA